MPSKASQGPDYSTLSYWQQRFSSTTQPFDWLNNGIDTLLTPLLGFLDELTAGGCVVPASFPPYHSIESYPQEQEEQELAQLSGEKGQDAKGPSILHIGVGSSVLSLSLLDQYIRRGWDPARIVNLDFAGSAVEAAKELERGYWRKLQQEQEEGNSHGRVRRETQEREKGYSGHDTCEADEPQMSYVQADLLSWSSIRRALDRLSDSEGNSFCREGFDAILDKSTTDAISTGEDVVYSSAELHTSSSETSPALSEFLKYLRRRGKDERDKVTLLPVHVLSLNLSSLTKRKCRWYVLSYSDDRFRDIPHLPNIESKSLWPWRVLSTKGIEAGGGAEKTGDGRIVHTPVVYHWAYELGSND